MKQSNAIPAPDPAAIIAAQNPPPEPKPIVIEGPKRLAHPPAGNLFTHSGYAVTTYDAIIPAEHSLEDILVSSYWVHRAANIKVHSIIRAYHEGGKFDVDLRVLDVGTGYAKVRLRVGGTYNDEAARAALKEDPRAGYKIQHIPGKRFVIQERSTGKIIKESCETREAAELALDEVVKTRR